MQTWPGRVALPADLFKAMPSTAFAQKVAHHTYLPSEVSDRLSSLIKAAKTPKTKAVVKQQQPPTPPSTSSSASSASSIKKVKRYVMKKAGFLTFSSENQMLLTTRRNENQSEHNN